MITAIGLTHLVNCRNFICQKRPVIAGSNRCPDRLDLVNRHRQRFCRLKMRMIKRRRIAGARILQIVKNRLPIIIFIAANTRPAAIKIMENLIKPVLALFRRCKDITRQRRITRGIIIIKDNSKAPLDLPCQACLQQRVKGGKPLLEVFLRHKLDKTISQTADRPQRRIRLPPISIAASLIKIGSRQPWLKMRQKSPWAIIETLASYIKIVGV